MSLDFQIKLFCCPLKICKQDLANWRERKEGIKKGKKEMKEQKGFLLGLRATIYNLDDQAQFSLLYP